MKVNIVQGNALVDDAGIGTLVYKPCAIEVKYPQQKINIDISFEMSDFIEKLGQIKKTNFDQHKL